MFEKMGRNITAIAHTSIRSGAATAGCGGKKKHQDPCLSQGLRVSAHAIRGRVRQPAAPGVSEVRTGSDERGSHGPTARPLILCCQRNTPHLEAYTGTRLLFN